MILLRERRAYIFIRAAAVSPAPIFSKRSFALKIYVKFTGKFSMSLAMVVFFASRSFRQNGIVTKMVFPSFTLEIIFKIEQYIPGGKN